MAPPNGDAVSLQADAAASLLADALAPAEWAVFRHVAGLMRAALAPEAAAASGLTGAALSALLSDLWFGPTPHSYKGKGAPRNPARLTTCHSQRPVVLADERMAHMPQEKRE